MMTHSHPKRRNNPDGRPEWLDTDMFTYQENMTIVKYNTDTANGKENTAIGFSDSSPVMNGPNTSKTLSMLELENSIYNICQVLERAARVQANIFFHHMD
jgi:hypothetical protein